MEAAQRSAAQRRGAAVQPGAPLESLLGRWRAATSQPPRRERLTSPPRCLASGWRGDGALCVRCPPPGRPAPSVLPPFPRRQWFARWPSPATWTGGSARRGPPSSTSSGASCTHPWSWPSRRLVACPPPPWTRRVSRTRPLECGGGGWAGHAWGAGRRRCPTPKDQGGSERRLAVVRGSGWRHLACRCAMRWLPCQPPCACAPPPSRVALTPALCPRPLPSPAVEVVAARKALDPEGRAHTAPLPSPEKIDRDSVDDKV